MIDEIIEKRSKGNAMMVGSIKVKLILKGIMVDAYNEQSEDDQEIIAKLEAFSNN